MNYREIFDRLYSLSGINHRVGCIIDPDRVQFNKDDDISPLESNFSEIYIDSLMMAKIFPTQGAAAAAIGHEFGHIVDSELWLSGSDEEVRADKFGILLALKAGYSRVEIFTVPDIIEKFADARLKGDSHYAQSYLRAEQMRKIIGQID